MKLIVAKHTARHFSENGYPVLELITNPNLEDYCFNEGSIKRNGYANQWSMGQTKKYESIDFQDRRGEYFYWVYDIGRLYEFRASMENRDKIIPFLEAYDKKRIRDYINKL